MAANLIQEADTAAVVTDETCGICLEDSKDPLDLPCGHSFCDGCLDEWRSRYGVDEEMRTKCPICRARIPPSKEMVTTLLSLRAQKQEMEDSNNTTSERYQNICRCLAEAEERVGEDWDGVTVLQNTSGKPPFVMSNHIIEAIKVDQIKIVLRWINANRTEDRVNAVTDAGRMGIPALSIASMGGHLTLMTLLLQLGANVDTRDCTGLTAIFYVLNSAIILVANVDKMFRLLLAGGRTSFQAH